MKIGIIYLILGVLIYLTSTGRFLEKFKKADKEFNRKCDSLTDGEFSRVFYSKKKK